jgi:hypothetical protein
MRVFIDKYKEFFLKSVPFLGSALPLLLDHVVIETNNKSTIDRTFIDREVGGVAQKAALFFKTDIIMREPFIHHVLSKYQNHCLDHSLSPGNASLLDFLIRNNLIYDQAMREFVVRNDFEYLYRQGKYKNKTRTIKALAQKYNLHENTVWGIIGRKSA